MSRIFFFGLVFGARVFALRIPFIIDDSGVPHVYTRIESVYGSDVVRMRLSTYCTSISRIPIGAEPVIYNHVFRGHGVSLLDPNSSREILRYTSDLFYTPFLRDRISGDTIGIDSSLVDLYGSVSFVADTRRSGFLELGYPYEDFVEHFCIPETVFNISLDFHVGFVAGEIHRIRNIVLSANSLRAYQLNELPQELYDPIETTIRSYSSRIVSDSPRLIFEGCAEVRTRLENIDLYFVDVYFVDGSNHEDVKGHIRFEPADFTKVIDDAENTCELLIGRAEDDEDHDILINSLMLTNVNIRFTPDSASLCDSSL